ncbi:hypothetical protein F5Y06DRAFT_299152 [Hypoxylon sp. FL0890]|nr:hypothetical protein F5Y06DRAFT_299152 [Hypoxylon sp. FL0890]
MSSGNSDNSLDLALQWLERKPLTPSDPKKDDATKFTSTSFSSQSSVSRLHRQEVLLLRRSQAEGAWYFGTTALLIFVLEA